MKISTEKYVNIEKNLRFFHSWITQQAYDHSNSSFASNLALTFSLKTVKDYFKNRTRQTCPKTNSTSQTRENEIKFQHGPKRLSLLF